MIISIEGNIGSGKSTLVKNLKQHLMEQSIPYVFVQEPVDSWGSICDREGEPILTKFYRDQERYAFSFQMMAYISRLSILRKAVKNNPDAVIITERCVHTDRHVFAKMLYDDDKIMETDYLIYLRWFDEFIEDVPIYGYVYLKTDAEVCFTRVEKRAREGETIPLAYLENCGKYHNEWMESNHSEKKLIIDGNTDIEKTPSIVTEWVNTIHAWILNEKQKKIRSEYKHVERAPLNFVV